MRPGFIFGLAGGIDRIRKPPVAATLSGRAPGSFQGIAAWDSLLCNRHSLQFLVKTNEMGMTYAASAVLQATAVLLQLTAAFFALKLIRVSGGRGSWILICSAFCFMAIRRSISLGELLSGGIPAPDLWDNGFAVAISALMLAGVLTIPGLFRAIQQAAETLRRARDDLEIQVAQRTAELAKANQELQEEIEERKRAEEALHRQQEEQQIILDSVPAMIFYKDTDNRVIRVNRALADLTGLPVEEIEGKAVSETFPKQAENFWKDDWEVITAGYPKRNIIEPVQTPMGIRWVQTDKLPYRDEKGNIIGVIGFSMDITERKQAEAALKESEERFRTIFEDAAIGIYLADLEGRIITSNLALQRMMGCAADELIEKTFMEITHPDDLERNLEFFHDLLAGRLEQYQLEKRYRRPDGQYFWARVTVSAVKGAGSAPLYNIAMIEDITQRKQAQENLRESEQNLRYLASQLMNAQERERERISRELHDELGQALLVMKLQASYIERGLGQDQGAIRRECRALLQHLDQLVEEIRRLARDLSPTMVRDLGLSSALLRLVKEFTRHYDIAADIDQMENIDDLFPRQAQINIYRIFQEALTNIGRYAQASRLRIAVKRQDSLVSFLVADNGRGFKVEELSRDQTRRGLGLMAMEERARMMGGTLEIWSQEGEGTRITLNIPISDRKVAQGGT
jgi:PAS domain S-box-containing protein